MTEPLTAVVLAVVLGAGTARARFRGTRGAADLERRVAAAHRRVPRGLRRGVPRRRRSPRSFPELGSAYLQRSETGRAIELLEEAWGWNSEDGLVLARLTLAYVMAEDYSFARFYLDLAREQEPRAPPDAYAVLGGLYDSVNRLEDAVLAWEQFERLGGEDPTTLAKLARARAEMSLSKNQRFREIGDFLSPTTRASRRRSWSRRRRAWRPRSASCPPSSACACPVASPSSCTRAGATSRSSRSPTGSPGPSTARSASPSSPGAASERSWRWSWRTSSRTHSSGGRRGTARRPGCTEGLAQWWEGKRLLPAELRAALAGRPLLSLPEMEGSLSRKGEPAAVRDAYAEALGPSST